MSDLHVVLGAGPLGTGVASALVRRGMRVRILNRTGSGRATGAESVAVDATDLSALGRAFAGAAVVYQCAQPPYHRWEREFPALQDCVLQGAEHARASVVIADNLYPYGDPDGRPITESSPETTTTRKGRLRRVLAQQALAAHEAGRLRVAISRPSHYFGPGYDQSGTMVFGRAMAGKAIRMLGRADQPHSFSYVPDVAAAMATLGTGDLGWGRVWIPPVQPAVTQAELAQRVWTAAGRPGTARTQLLGRRMATVLGTVSPTMRELREMMYEFEKPYLVDSSDFQTNFGATPTALDEAIATTLRWYAAKSTVDSRAVGSGGR